MIFYTFSLDGPRANNQDAVSVQLTETGTLIAAIADGVGGEAAGHIASEMSVELAASKLLKGEEISRQMFVDIDASIKAAAAKDHSLEGMATTLSVCTISGDCLKLGHCGDSRILVLRGNGIQQLTSDHTEVSRLLREGILSKEDVSSYPRKNLLDSAIGASKELQYCHNTFLLEKSDRVLLVTDGVYDVVPKRELRDLSLGSDTPEEFAVNLLAAGLESRLKDNATIAIIDL